jgi:hypothetical protein
LAGPELAAFVLSGRLFDIMQPPFPGRLLEGTTGKNWKKLQANFFQRRKG